MSGAIIARELAIHSRRLNPDDDLVAGLLRDLGEVLLQQAFASSWEEHRSRHAARLVEDPCSAEMASFGIDHADVKCGTSARLEAAGRDRRADPLPPPIGKARLAPKEQARDVAELLHFASLLVHLDMVAQRPDLLERLLATARDRFKFSKQAAWSEFLQAVAPKDRGIRGGPNKTSVNAPTTPRFSPPGPRNW